MLDQLKSEQEQLGAARDACRDLQEKPVELSVRRGSKKQLADKQEVEIFIQKTTTSHDDTAQKI